MQFFYIITIIGDGHFRMFEYVLTEVVAIIYFCQFYFVNIGTYGQGTAIFIVRVSMIVIFMPKPTPVFETIIKTVVSAYPDKFLSLCLAPKCYNAT